jgi:hypothetical protein
MDFPSQRAAVAERAAGNRIELPLESFPEPK